MKTNKSAPLTPLSPPTGITGTKLEAHSPGCICAACVPPLFSPIPTSPVKDTPAGFVGVLIAPDGARHFSCYDTPGMTLERSGAMEFTSREAAEKACLFRLGKGDAFWNSERSARQSMAKEMEGWTYVVEPATAPASPVDSVGVPVVDLQNVEVRDDGSLWVDGEEFGSVTSLIVGASIVTACNSQAAKDAKMREADEILKRCAMWLGKMIADGGHMQCVAPNDCVRTLERVEAFRAALALPCAPLGS